MPIMLGVNVAIFDDERILLTKREDFEVWCLPGGAVDMGESVAQAAVREAREETGLDVELTRLVGIYSRPKWRDGSYNVVLFAARVVSGTMQGQAGEVIDLRFFPFSDLPDDMLLGQRHRVQDAIAGVGGGVVKTEDVAWPFDSSLTRRDEYALRDQSDLPRAEYYARHYPRLSPEQIRIEVDDHHK